MIDENISRLQSEGGCMWRREKINGEQNYLTIIFDVPEAERQEIVS